MIINTRVATLREITCLGSVAVVMDLRSATLHAVGAARCKGLLLRLDRLHMGVERAGPGEGGLTGCDAHTL